MSRLRRTPRFCNRRLSWPVQVMSMLPDDLPPSFARTPPGKLSRTTATSCPNEPVLTTMAIGSARACDDRSTALDWHADCVVAVAHVVPVSAGHPDDCGNADSAAANGTRLLPAG